MTLPMKIDLFNHFFPKRYFDQFIDTGGIRDIGKRVRNIQAIHDLEFRFKVMDEIRAEVSTMQREEIGLREARLAEMTEAYWRAIASGIISSLLGLGLTGVVGFLIFRAEAARRREDWLQGGRVGLSKAMLGDQPTEQLGNNILGYLCK